ncbi:MAG: two-component sensor histidine kinase, partial [Rhodocyclaceae bacterium]|nr:two-component sensor histidine kinase [Rhodocyclaceae bacterium]
VTDVEEIDKTIGQFLDFARADDGEAFTITPLSEMLQDINTHYGRLGVELITDIQKDISIQVRPKAIRRAISNLIDNALRYGGESPISLSLHQDKQGIRIGVADRGPGIPAEQVDRLKLPFTRLDQSRGNMTGAGLGLAIVERILRGHGGRFDLLPREGGGLLAQLTLPA